MSSNGQHKDPLTSLLFCLTNPHLMIQQNSELLLDDDDTFGGSVDDVMADTP